MNNFSGAGVVADIRPKAQGHREENADSTLYSMRQVIPALSEVLRSTGVPARMRRRTRATSPLIAA